VAKEDSVHELLEIENIIISCMKLFSSLSLSDLLSSESISLSESGWSMVVKGPGQNFLTLVGSAIGLVWVVKISLKNPNFFASN